MAHLKTSPNEADVHSFLETLEDEQKKKDCYFLVQLIQEITGQAPRMWGTAIVGFDTYHYKYESGREGDWFVTGFSPRKQNISIYIMSGFNGFEELMKKLGKHKTGKSCLYVKRLSDVNMDVLEEMIKLSVRWMKEKYG